MNSKSIFCLVLTVSGLFAAHADDAVPRISGTNVIIGSTNVTVKLVVPGRRPFFRPSTPCQIEEVPEKIIYYVENLTNRHNGWPATNWIGEVHDPHTGKVGLVWPECSFIVSDEGGMVAFQYFGMDVLWRRSFFEISDSAPDRDERIANFISTCDFERVWDDGSRVMIRDAAPMDFFWERSSVCRPSKLDRIEVTDDVLRLDIVINDGKGGKYDGAVDREEERWRGRDDSPHYGVEGTFWIDLKKREVIKSAVDGYRMNLHTGDFAVPYPFLLPINPGTLRWGLIPMAIGWMMAAATLCISYRARSRLQYRLSVVALLGLAWALTMLFRVYFLGQLNMEVPEFIFNGLGNYGIWLSIPSHLPQVVVAGAVVLVAIQSRLLRSHRSMTRV